MTAAEQSAGWCTFISDAWSRDYKSFLAVFCYAVLFTGLPRITFHLHGSSIKREFGVRETDLRLTLVVESLSTFILSPFIVFLGRMQRRPLFIGVTLFFTGVSCLLVVLAHLLTDPDTYMILNVAGRLTCDAHTTEVPQTANLQGDIEANLF